MKDPYRPNLNGWEDWRAAISGRSQIVPATTCVLLPRCPNLPEALNSILRKRFQIGFTSFKDLGFGCLRDPDVTQRPTVLFGLARQTGMLNVTTFVFVAARLLNVSSH